MGYFTVDIYTPNSVKVKDMTADSLLIPTVKGQINVLPEHTHIITKLDTGILTIQGPADDKHFTITTGLCKVLKNKVTILSDVSESKQEIDIERAKNALKKAQEKLESDENFSNDGFYKYRRKIDRAEMRIKLSLMKEI